MELLTGRRISGVTVHPLLRDVALSLQRYGQGTAAYQKFLYAVAVILLTSGLFHSAIFLVSGGSWQGDVSWRKPILFGFSFGITAFSLGWVLTYLPRH
jgi:hypothetical protein